MTTETPANGIVRVLLVEDNRGEAHLIRDMLSRTHEMRFEVEHVPRFGHAVERLQRESPDVLLLDLRLPDREGLSMFEEVRHEAPETPIVVLTNLHDEDTAVRAVRRGAQDYLVKRDVDAKTLIRSIRYAMERQRTESALRESEERYALAVNGANDGLWDWHILRGRAYFSWRWKAILGCENEEISEDIDEWFRRVHPSDVASLRSALEAHLQGRSGHFEHEHRMRNKQGEYLWVLSRGLAVRDGRGRAYRMAGSMTDVTGRKLAEAQLLHDAMHDHLTGLPNRHLFLDRLEFMLRRYQRDPHKLFAVLFFDLDHFKNINDSLGHGAGDELLIEITRRLQTFLRPGDTLARLGGDEFAILLGDVSSVTDASYVADRIYHVLGETFELRGQEVFTSASIGIAISAEHYQRPEEILRDADLAMYRAKGAGKARYEVFDNDMHQRAVALLRREAELRRAVEREEFVIHYQPIIALGTECIVGVEGLVRWRHPQLGLIGPDAFIPIAEERNLVIPIGWWVLHEACAQTRRWQDLYDMDPPLSVSVNVPGKLFMQQGMVSRIVEILEETRLAPHSLQLEITEGAVMHHGERAMERLRELRDLGVRLSLDDFGTGYSSLAYLQRFAYDSLKIDRSFVGTMEHVESSEAIVRTLITLGQSLQMTVVAEGVETRSQLEALRAMSCPQAQGFWFSRPVSGAEVERLFGRGGKLQRDRSETA